jgi:hypothetical protein
MIIRSGIIFLLVFVMGCQSSAIVRPNPAESDIRKDFQLAMLFLKEQEYQKAAQVYLHIAKAYPQHPRAEEAGIMGQELQRLESMTQSLTASKETALKDLREVTQGFKQLSEQNAKREGLEKENLRLRSELHQMEERLNGLASLKKENNRLQSEMDQLKASLKELHEIEQKMKQPMELPSQPENLVR